MGMSASRTRSNLLACSAERVRIARDLHDGVVQSLIATEMQIDSLRRQSGSHGAAMDLSETLENVQDLIRQEVRKLRQQIEQLRSSPTPYRVLICLAEMVEGFQQETGIATTFACDVQEDSIPPDLAHEILRIVEEALSNVRRHSGARRAEVRLALQVGTLQVVIQDDGCGFDFSGRLSLVQLESKRKGPRVIRERVHSMNGEFTLESAPNRGARLEIQFASNRLKHAEHQAPTLVGKELTTESAPLGMIASAEFPVMHFPFAEGSVPMLMSVGLAEVGREPGHPFSLERIHERPQKPMIAVESHAATTQNLEKEDEISLLRMVRDADLVARTG